MTCVEFRTEDGSVYRLDLESRQLERVGDPGELRLLEAEAPQVGKPFRYWFVSSLTGELMVRKTAVVKATRICVTRKHRPSTPSDSSKG